MSNDEVARSFNLQMTAEHIINDLETLKVFCDPLRYAILRSVSGHPRRIKEIAQAINKAPTSLYYHINKLEQHDLIYTAGERLISGAVSEKYYHVRARVFRIRRDLRTFVNSDDHESIESQMEAVLDSARRDIRDCLTSGAIAPDETPPHPLSVLIDRRITRLSPEQAHIFYERMLNLLDQFEREGEDSYPHYSLSVMMHPISAPGD